MRIEVLRSGKRKLRFDPAIVKALEGYGKKVMVEANETLTDEDDGFRMSSYRGRNRHRVTVMAVSAYAVRSDRKHNTLTRLLGGL